VRLENASFQLPKSSGCRPNLQEGWVGGKISLDNDQWQWVVDCNRQPKKNNEQFDLSLEGANLNSFLAHDVPAKQNILQSEKMYGLHKSEFCTYVLLQTDHILLK
jgi:hypothetical protein